MTLRDIEDRVYPVASILGVVGFVLFMVFIITGRNVITDKRWVAKEIEFHGGAKEVIWVDQSFEKGDTVKHRIYTYILIKRL